MSRREVQKQFGTYAADYINSRSHARGASLGRLVELLGPEPGWKVLDIATGAGHTALTFAPYVNRVWATDITEQMLEITRQQALERGINNLTVEYADAEDLPYTDRSFDLVTCRIAAHHFPDVQAFLGEAARVTRPGGMLAVVDNVVPSGPEGDYINAYDKLRDPSHGRCLSMEEWLQRLVFAGFELEHQEMMNMPMVFEEWASRHDEQMKRYLAAVLTQAPAEVKAWLEPREIDDQLTFQFKVGIIIGRQ